MATELVCHVLRKVVAQLTWQIGFASATQPALEILTDLLDERLSSICVETKRYAELDRRTDPDLRDLHVALMRRNVSFSDVLDYVNEVEPIPLMVDVPRFPAHPEKIQQQLAKAENGGRAGDRNEILLTEAEDGSQTALVPVAVNGTVSGGPGVGVEKKPFSNETGMQPTKRARLPPEEAVHSQHVMASFAITESGHVPIKRCLKAIAAYAPPSPKRPHLAHPDVPAYLNEPKKVTDNFILEETALQQYKFTQPNQLSKKAKNSGRETTLKQLKPKKTNLTKLQKHPNPLQSRIKLPKPKKEDKILVKKAKTLSKKALKSTHLTTHGILPQDIIKVEDVPSSALDQELQKSRISSYEDSINAVIKNTGPEKVKCETSDFKSPSPLPPVVRPDLKDAEDNFYLDIDEPLDSCHLSQLAAEREAHINDTIEGVIAKASLDDDLRMSPETGESDFELETRGLQSAVVDRFDVSSVPSPQIPPTWQMLEEEVEEETVAKVEKDESKMALPEVGSMLAKQKSKKTKSRRSEWPIVNVDTEPQINADERDKKSNSRPSEWLLPNVSSLPHVKIEEKEKKQKNRSFERLAFGLDSAASRDTEEWDKKSKQSLDQLLDLSRGSCKVPDEPEKRSKPRLADRQPSNLEPFVSKTMDELEKKPKHRSMDRQPLDRDLFVSMATDESDKKSKHRTVERQPLDLRPLANSVGDESEKKSKHRFVERQHDLDPFVYNAADELEIKSKHRSIESSSADNIIPSRKDVGDRDKKSKHRSQGGATFNSISEPPKETERQSDIFSNKGSLTSATECPKAPLEAVTREDGRKMKRPASPVNVPSPVAASPAVLSPSLSADTNFTGQPPLKRIKIVTSAGDVNQFEIKPMKDEKYKHKKKDKKLKKNKDHERSHSRKERERSRDHKDREKSHDHRDHEKSCDRKDRDKTNKEDRSKKGTNVDLSDPFDLSLLPYKSTSDWDKNMKLRSVDDQSLDRDSLVGRMAEESEKKIKHRSDRQPLEIGAFVSRTADESEKKSRSGRKFKEEANKQRSRDLDKKDKSRDDRSDYRKDEKQKERSDKSLDRNEHKKDKAHKKEEKQIKEEILPTPTAAVPAVPKLTLKFSKTPSGTPSVVKSSEPEQLTEPEQLPEHGEARFSSPIKPIKLRFKGGLAGLATAVEFAPPPYNFPNEKTETPPKPRSPFEVPTFSPSPESICIPSPHSSSGWCSDEMEKPTAARGRAAVRTPTPPSLSIPAPIMSKTRLPSRSSFSPSPNRSRSPPILFRSQDVERQAPVLAQSKKLFNTPSSVSTNAKSDSKNVQIPKMDALPKVSPSVKTPLSSKLPSSSKSAKSSSKSVTHTKGMPPSTVMPPATPVQSLLPLTTGKSVGGSSKTKKRVTTETVNKIDKPDGTTVWFCPDCREEADEWSIGCDKCDDWYHWSCVGIVVAPPEEEKWFCRRCVGQPKESLKTPHSGRGRGKKAKK